MNALLPLNLLAESQQLAVALFLDPVLKGHCLSTAVPRCYLITDLAACPRVLCPPAADTAAHTGELCSPAID